FVDQSFTLHAIEERVFRVAQALDDRADFAAQGVAGQIADAREIEFIHELAVDDAFEFFEVFAAAIAAGARRARTADAAMVGGAVATCRGEATLQSRHCCFPGRIFSFSGGASPPRSKLRG